MANDINKLQSKGLGGVELTTPEVRTVEVPAKKKKSKVGRFFEGLGGADDVLAGISSVAGEGARIVKSAKKSKQTEDGNAASDDGSYDFSLGQNDDQPGEKIFGMPSIAFYTIIGVVTLLAAFLTFKLVYKK